mmetsp:Transcript_6324/g.15589  ORF Transcript_6324/g.15589 Transcript_6324/m.15589 type:complete len:291 (-) Transcript_6324:195-1067(-)
MAGAGGVAQIPMAKSAKELVQAWLEVVQYQEHIGVEHAIPRCRRRSPILLRRRGDDLGENLAESCLLFQVRPQGVGSQGEGLAEKLVREPLGAMVAIVHDLMENDVSLRPRHGLQRRRAVLPLCLRACLHRCRCCGVRHAAAGCGSRSSICAASPADWDDANFLQQLHPLRGAHQLCVHALAKGAPPLELAAQGLIKLLRHEGLRSFFEEDLLLPVLKSRIVLQVFHEAVEPHLYGGVPTLSLHYLLGNRRYVPRAEAARATAIEAVRSRLRRRRGQGACAATADGAARA